MSAQIEETKSASAAPGYTNPSEEGEKKVILIQAPTEAAQPGFELDESVARQTKNMNLIESFVAELRHPTFVQSFMGEFVGTAVFLFMLYTAILPGTNDALIFRVATTAGASIAVLVYGLYGVSGGNLNPAVSLGLVVMGRMSVVRAVGYIIAQCIGAITGAAMTKFVCPTAFALLKGGANGLQKLIVTTADGKTVVPITAGQGVFGEALGTFLLVIVVLFCTDTHRTVEFPHMTALIPFAIGIAVMIDHLVLIPITGCSVNPARSLGSAVIANTWQDHWVFWVGPMAGGAAAALVYRLVYLPTEAFNALWGRNGIWAAPVHVTKSMHNTLKRPSGSRTSSTSSV